MFDVIHPKVVFIDVTFLKRLFLSGDDWRARDRGKQKRHKMSNAWECNLCVSIYEMLFPIPLPSLHLGKFNKLRQFERSIKWNWTWLCSQKVNGWALETRDMTPKCSLWHVQFIHFTQHHAVYIHLIMCGNGNSQWNNPPQLAIRKTLTICFSISSHLKEKKKIAHRAANYLAHSSRFTRWV